MKGVTLILQPWFIMDTNLILDDRIDQLKGVHKKKITTKISVASRTRDISESLV